MDDQRALTFALETLRKENQQEHKEILQKLNQLCTKTAVNETRLASLEKFGDAHIEDHEGDSRTRLGYYIAFLVLGVSALIEFFIEIFRRSQP